MQARKIAERAYGYVWPAESVRPDEALDCERDRVRAAAGDVHLLSIAQDEGTPPAEVGEALLRCMADALNGAAEALIVSVADGPAFTLYLDEHRFEDSLAPLRDHPLVLLAILDARKRAPLVPTATPRSSRSTLRAVPNVRAHSVDVPPPLPASEPPRRRSPRERTWQVDPPTRKDRPAAHTPAAPTVVARPPGRIRPPSAPLPGPLVIEPPAHSSDDGASPDADDLPPAWLIGLLVCAAASLLVLLLA